MFYQRYVVARTNRWRSAPTSCISAAICMVNVGVLAALILDQFVKVPILDPIFGAAIGLWIIYSATRLLLERIDPADGPRMPDEDRARIRAIAEAADEVAAVHDLKTRVAGPTTFIQLHLEMDGAMDLRRAHEIADRVEAQLRDAYPQAEIIVHQDPAGLEEYHQEFPARASAT